LDCTIRDEEPVLGILKLSGDDLGALLKGYVKEVRVEVQRIVT
jgi:hypothetical protein